MNSNAVTATTLDEAPQRLWLEWLKIYFDGGTHRVCGENKDFPAVDVGFDVAQLDQPMDGVTITVVAKSRGGRSYVGDAAAGEQRLCWEQVTWMFIVRARMLPTGSGAGKGNGTYQCRGAAQLLRGLLKDPTATVALAQKGICNLRVGEAVPVQDEKTARQVLMVNGEMHYEIKN